jgi:eukaryotic-like serine/threonine-protein kinase
MTADRTSPDPPEPLGGGDSDDGTRDPEGLARLLEVGRVLAGKYRVDGVLGRGGMGVVAAGRQLELDRPVAVKFLHHRTAGREQSGQRFAREARAIAKMRSEHVVRVIDVGVEEGVPFIVMERLVGHDLATELRRSRPPWNLAVEWLLHACEALGEAHSLGIVHRDIKPSNLFLAETVGSRRVLKVLDFGVSKWLGPPGDFEAALVTSNQSLVGTPAFVSPEQLTRPDSVDERSDIWALGVVLYQCLCGRLPFHADSMPRLYAEVLTAKPLAAFPPDVPEALRAVVLRCLEKSPGERYPSAVELARALTPFAPSAGAQVLASLEPFGGGAKRTSVGIPNDTVPETTALETAPTTLGFTHDTSAPSESRGAITPAIGPSVARKRSLLALLALAGLLVLAIAISRRAQRTPPSETQDIAEPVSPNPRPASAAPELQPSGASTLAPPVFGVPSATASTGAERKTAPARKPKPLPGNIPKPAGSSSASRVEQEPSPAPSAAPEHDAQADDFDRTRIFRR